MRLQVESAAYSPSHDSLEVVLGADIAVGWHVNAHQPSDPTLIPTKLEITPPTGFEVGAIRYPEPERRELAFAKGKPLEVYSGHVSFRVPLFVRTDFTKEGASFSAKLRYQPCDETRCLRPAEVERTFLVKRPADVETGAPKTTAPASNQAPVEQWLTRHGLLPTLALVFAMGLALNLTPCVYPLISVTLAYFGTQARERCRNA